MIRFSRPLLTLALVATTVSVAHAACLPASGKITNNAQLDGSTLGSIALKLGTQNYKCGIVGKPNGVTGGYLPKFIHTIVCDDKADAGAPQGQISFDTSVASLTPTGAIGSCGSPSYSAIGAPFQFHEESGVMPGTGRGIFGGVTSGKIAVDGDFNCQGGIVMTFSGQICTGN